MMPIKQYTCGDSEKLSQESVFYWTMCYLMLAAWSVSFNLSTHVICHRSCMLQADSEKLRQAWIKAVQTSIATAYREKGDESEVSLKTNQTTTAL